jgi:hypothetical protein
MQAQPLHQNLPLVGQNIFRSSNSFSMGHFIDTTDDTVHINDILGARGGAVG